MEQYAVVLIKPDAIRDVLEEMILYNLQKETGAIPVFRKFWRITESLARLIYPSWVERPEFPSMVHNITQGVSLFVIVRGDETIYELLTKVKGKMNQGGLRLRYRTSSIEEWQKLGYSGQELQNKIAENRLHTTDDFTDTILLCNFAMSNHDLTEIELSATSLATAVRLKRAIQPWTAP